MRKFIVGLSSNALYALESELKAYKEEYEAKIQIFLEKLVEVGISAAQQHEGDFAGYIVYSKKFEYNNGEKQTVHLIARDSQIIPKAWYVSPKSTEVREVSINPLLMAEFGSGHYAVKAEGEASGMGGQGTLNTYGHAFDDNGWYWWTDSPDTSSDDDINAVSRGRYRHHSRGVTPSQPLHNAVKTCIEQVLEVAQEVFG